MSDLTGDPRVIDTPGGGTEDRGLTGDDDVVAGKPGQEGPIADRLDRDPGNLGGEVEGAGDITYPTPDQDGPQM